jgi:hypothetical protein
VRCNSCSKLFASCDEKHNGEMHDDDETMLYTVTNDCEKCAVQDRCKQHSYYPRNRVYARALGFCLRNNIDLSDMVSMLDDEMAELEDGKGGNDVYDLSEQIKLMKKHNKTYIPGQLMFDGEVVSDDDYENMVKNIDPRFLGYTFLLKCDRDDTFYVKDTQEKSFPNFWPEVNSCKELHRAFVTL